MTSKPKTADALVRRLAPVGRNRRRASGSSVDDRRGGTTYTPGVGYSCRREREEGGLDVAAASPPHSGDIRGRGGRIA
jgi:hypothetical protein